MGVCMYTIILNDQTELPCQWCGQYEEVLSASIAQSLIECAVIFSDQEKTKTIVFDYGVDRDTFEGYTRLIGLRVDGNNTVLQLRKGVASYAADDNAES